MDLNIRHFVAILFVASVAALFLLKPHHVTFVNKKGIPQAAFYDFKTYEITSRGVDDILTGTTAKKYPRRLRIEAPRMRRRTPQGDESVTANIGELREKRDIRLDGNVTLRRNDGWRLRTSHLRYAFASRLYTTEGRAFVIDYGQSRIWGKKLRYYQKSGKIYARKIRANIKTDVKRKGR